MGRPETFESDASDSTPTRLHGISRNSRANTPPVSVEEITKSNVQVPFRPFKSDRFAST
jgi:hypothetical protein